MEQPRARYLMQLARALNKPLFELLAWPEEELVAQMAYDLSQQPDFIEQVEREKHLALPPEERVKRDMAILRGEV